MPDGQTPKHTAVHVLGLLLGHDVAQGIQNAFAYSQGKAFAGVTFNDLLALLPNIGTEGFCALPPVPAVPNGKTAQRAQGAAMRALGVRTGHDLANAIQARSPQLNCAFVQYPLPLHRVWHHTTPVRPFLPWQVIQ